MLNFASQHIFPLVSVFNLLQDINCGWSHFTTAMHRPPPLPIYPTQLDGPVAPADGAVWTWEGGFETWGGCLKLFHHHQNMSKTQSVIAKYSGTFCEYFKNQFLSLGTGPQQSRATNTQSPDIDQKLWELFSVGSIGILTRASSCSPLSQASPNMITMLSSYHDNYRCHYPDEDELGYLDRCIREVWAIRGETQSCNCSSILRHTEI